MWSRLPVFGRHGAPEGPGACLGAENGDTEPRGDAGAYAEHPGMPNRSRDSIDP